MADLVTKIDDVIVPEIFGAYTEEKTTEKSVFLNSGAMENDSRINALVSGAGVTFNMPKWEDLTGDDEPFNEDKAETSKVGSHNEIGTSIYRRKQWAFHDLAAAFAGDDPQRDMADKVSRFWVRKERDTALSILNGVFASASMADHVLDVSAETESAINDTNILDAKQLLGDAADELSLLYMHSAAYTHLQKQLLTKPIVLPNSKVELPGFLGYVVIMDDSVPVDLTDPTKPIFSTYLLARGCLKRGVGTPVGWRGVATDREEAEATSRLFYRRAFCLHPVGMSWNARPSDITPNKTPSNAQLATGTNWTRVATEGKMVKMVKLVHTL